MVAGSFFLTPATALRYERHDRKMRRLSEEERMGLKRDMEDGGGNGRGRRVRDVEAAEEYYRLAAKDLDDWENKRVERFRGEPDGVL